MKKLYYASFAYMVAGLFLGAFYREYTKANDFTGITQLSTTHTHAFALGMVFLLIVLALDKGFSLSSHKGFGKWFALYNIGLVGVIGTMIARGILQVVGSDIVGLNYMAGLMHTVYAISLVWFFLILKKKLV